MPHSGPRGSPRTLVRKHDTPAWATAAERSVPEGTVIALPFTEMVKWSRIAGAWFENSEAGALEHKVPLEYLLAAQGANPPAISRCRGKS